MANFVPGVANNVTAGAFGGLISAVTLHVLGNYGITLAPDIANALPYAFAVVIAHVYDMATGGNKPVT